MATLVDFFDSVPTFHPFNTEYPMSSLDFARSALHPLGPDTLRLELERWAPGLPKPSSVQDVLSFYDHNQLASFVSFLEQRGLIDDDGNGIPPEARPPAPPAPDPPPYTVFDADDEDFLQAGSADWKHGALLAEMQKSGRSAASSAMTLGGYYWFLEHPSSPGEPDNKGPFDSEEDAAINARATLGLA